MSLKPMATWEAIQSPGTPMGIAVTRGMMLPCKDKWTLEREHCKENETHALMLIFDAQDVVMQVFVIRKRCWDLQNLLYLTHFLLMAFFVYMHFVFPLMVL